MPNVVRFALDSERDLYVPGAGYFNQGILDIPAGNAALLARVRYRVQPYGVVELGITDETTPPPDLPAEGPGDTDPDPYPQYVADADFVVPVAAPTGVAEIDASNIQTAINAAAAAGGGVVQLRAGIYVVNTLLIKTGVYLRGEGIGATIIKLANGTNADLITVPNFSTLDAGNTSGGETKWAIEHLTLDGNGDNQTGTSWPLRVYAYNYRINDVQIERGLSGNAYSKWGNSAGGDMEAIWSRFKLLAPISETAIGLDWNGPHDSIFTDGEVVAHMDAVEFEGQTGIRTGGNAGGEQFVNVHVWGFHKYGWIARNTINALNCDAEGSWAANVLLKSGRCRFHGRVFGTNGFNPTEVGIQFGDAEVSGVKNCDIDVNVFGFAAGGFALNFFSSGGFNRIQGIGLLGTSTAFYTGTISPNDRLDLLSQDGAIDLSGIRLPQPLNIRPDSTAALSVGSTPTFLVDAQNKHVAIRGGGLLRGYTAGGTQSWFVDNSNGAFSPGTTVGAGARIFSGTGAPTLSGIAGDFYFRKDPTTGNERIYQNTANGVNWVAIDNPPAESVFLSATEFLAASGSPTLTGAPGAAAWPRWLLDATTQEIVATTLAVPLGWATANVFLWYSNEGAGSGVARFQVRAHTDRASGGSMTTSETVHGTIDPTVPAQGVLARMQVGTALTVSATPTASPRSLMGLSVRRLAADAADTLANDAALIGVELVRAS